MPAISPNQSNQSDPSNPSKRLAHRPALLGGAALLLGLAIAVPTAVASETGPPPVHTAAAPAVPASDAAPILAKLDCAALPAQDLTQVPDAPSRILSASVITLTPSPTSGPVQVCDVKGYISPQTQFELKLPVATWHGEYVQLGCGGLCGDIPATAPAASSGCTPVTHGELATGADNEGHVGASRLDGLWAKDDPRARTVFGYTSEHSLAQVAKAVMKAYYGQAPTHAYYDGCSDGGREALIEAQRFPGDFNGILAGDPALDATDFTTFETWIYRSNTDTAGRQILGAAKLPALHAAVLKACAGPDGLIDDPRTCAFEPASVQCAPGADDVSCLTADQVAVVRKFYTGPVDDRGRNLYPGGLAYGSELAWATAGADWDIAPTDDAQAAAATRSAQFAVNFLKYLAYPTNPPNSFMLRDFRFTDESSEKLQELAGLYNATNPDLAAFRARGGKIILYHGWADQAISPFGTVAYYHDVVTRAGGYNESQAFSRLYMIPAQYHCLGTGGGDPLATGDLLSPLMAWVENGQAPESVSFTTQHPDTTQPATITVQPMNPLTVVTPATGPGYNTGYRWIGRFR